MPRRFAAAPVQLSESNRRLGVNATADAGATIIVVEPDVLIRMVIAKYLRECGFRVIEATEAADVWAAIDSGLKVDIVFTEVRLPGKTGGFSLASLVRQRHPEIDVI